MFFKTQMRISKYMFFLNCHFTFPLAVCDSSSVSHSGQPLSLSLFLTVAVIINMRVVVACHGLNLHFQVTGEVTHLICHSRIFFGKCLFCLFQFVIGLVAFPCRGLEALYAFYFRVLCQVGGARGFSLTLWLVSSSSGRVFHRPKVFDLDEGQ